MENYNTEKAFNEILIGTYIEIEIKDRNYYIGEVSKVLENGIEITYKDDKIYIAKEIIKRIKILKEEVL